MTPAAEPLSLRLPRELLVLQPMQGHLDLEPMLLAPGLRCVIGSAESCAVRLTTSALVQSQHCVVEIVGRQTLLTEWVPQTTWLNDRLVLEPTELVPGDRISIGPFDFRVRTASADELLYAKLVERDSSESNKVEDVLRLKRAIETSGRDRSIGLTGANNEPALGMFGELLRETSDGSDPDTHERLTQHISKLLGDLQNQVLSLQEKEAELNEQIRSQREETDSSRPSVEPPTHDIVVPQSPVSSPAEMTDSVPVSVRPEYEQVLQLLKAERDQLDHERSQLADEQARWQDQQREWSERLVALESQLSELETQRQSVHEEQDICRSLATELMRDEARMTEWQDRLRHEERQLAELREELQREKVSHRERDFATHLQSVRSIEVTPPKSNFVPFVAPALPDPAHWSNQVDPSSEPGAASPASRPLQTLLTLVAFSLSAFLLSGSLGDDVNTTIGWGTALLGVLSTADLLLHRYLSASR